jgi:leucyl aminopeptidase (aminopeptidase T)
MKEGAFGAYLKDTVSRAESAGKLLGELQGNTCLERLREINDFWFAPLQSDAYGGDFSNPDVSAEAFGLRPGQLLSAFRYEVLGLLPAVFQGEESAVARVMETLSKLEQGGVSRAEDLLVEHFRTPDKSAILGLMRRNFDPEESHTAGIMSAASGGDLSFLYRHGLKVSPVHEDTAGFLFSLPQRELRSIADTLAEGYSLGLREEAKDIFTRRNVVSVGLPLGTEALFPHISAAFAEAGLLAHAAPVHRPPVSRQANYDHRFKYALYLDRDTVGRQVKARSEVFEEMAHILRRYSGVARVDLFGEKPFSPVPKESMVRADRETSALYNSLTQQMVTLQQVHMPRGETSFSMMAFPSPEIGPAFRDIFRECIRVNTLSNDVYRPVQTALIEAMDGAEKVRILGAPGNDTDITVALRPLSDSVRETAFENCLASVNIPVGEVFTSPMLRGTDGVLHVGEAFLSGLRYENLRMVFRDGEAVEWSCTNFDDPEKGREYIRENIFFPHESLPMGEFAIGTNTVAYAMGVRHGIMGLLPVLILEKTGPHFAVGDTCYSREEDREVFDPATGKKLVAVENERSALRRTDPDRAYTNRHVDITLPYSGLDSISAIHPDGREVFLMRRGRFTLPGTELLNEPLEGLDG